MTSGRVAFAIEDRGQFAAGDGFGPSGAYERLVGKVHVRVDPTSVPEGSIADLELAPSDEDGLIGCTADFMILKPVDLGRANGVATAATSARFSSSTMQRTRTTP